MLTFSVNCDFTDIVEAVLDKVDVSRPLNKWEREYLSHFILNMIDNGKDYKDVGSFARTTSKYEMINKLASEVNIVLDGEKKVIGGLHISTLEMEMRDIDDYLTTTSVVNKLSQLELVKDWFDICDMALIDFGVNIITRLRICMFGNRDKKQLKQFLFDKELGLYPIFESYGAVNILREVMNSKELLELCLNEESWSKHIEDNRFLNRPSTLIRFSG